MGNKRISPFGIIVFLLGMGALAASFTMPLLGAFSTLQANSAYIGPLSVWNAFPFIFGGTAHASMEIGVGEATTLITMDDTVATPTLMGLVGYCLLIGGAGVSLAGWACSLEKRKAMGIAFAILAACSLIAGGVLMLLAGREAAAYYFTANGKDALTTLEEVGYQIGDGFLWCGTLAFIGAPFILLGTIRAYR